MMQKQEPNGIHGAHGDQPLLFITVTLKRNPQDDEKYNEAIHRTPTREIPAGNVYAAPQLHHPADNKRSVCPVDQFINFRQRQAYLKPHEPQQPPANTNIADAKSHARLARNRLLRYQPQTPNGGNKNMPFSSARGFLWLAGLRSRHACAICNCFKHQHQGGV